MIELAEGIFINPEHVSMVKHIDENQCQLFFVGQSALEGFVLPYAASQVAEALDDYFDDTVDDDQDDSDQDEE